MRFVSWVLGFAVGYGIGWVAGRLYAPKPGAEIVRGLEERYRYVSTEADRAAEATRQELQARYQAAKSSASAAT